MGISTYLDLAIRNGKTVTIKYVKREGEYSTRMISDIHYSNEYGNGDDYIDAYCHKRHERRTFKISRIIEIDGITNTSTFFQKNKTNKTAYTGNK